MNKLLSAGAALLLTTTAATAGGLDRGGNSYAVLFEDGNYVELSFSKTMPEVSGDYDAALGGGSTGDMADDYVNFGVALKYALTDQLDVGLFLNQPYGANANYPEGTYSGLAADWESNQIAIVLKYQVNPNISVYGGARSVETTAEIAIPDALNRGGVAASLQSQLAAATQAGDATAIATIGAQLQGLAAAPVGTFDYTATTESNRQTSYIAGAAYERPDIALRVALTYESGYTHDLATSETLPGAGLGGFESTTDIEMPQSVTLDFQTGVNPTTLVFGSVKWSEWSVWEVRPAGYEGFSGDRVTGIDNDVYTYRLGVGKQINEQLSVFGRVTYEEGTGDVASRLSPTDGLTSIGIGGTFTQDNLKITGGIEFAQLGDATDSSNTVFSDNKAVGFGVTIGTSF